MLKDAGVQWGQGHLLAEPLGLDAFLRYYEQAPRARLSS